MKLKQPLELNDDFQFALDTLEKTNKNMFITGRAGTGKSTLLHLFKNTTRKKCVVLAPTGVAALNVQGQTIHSFFGFPAKFFGTEEIKKRRDVRLYKKMEVLIIDEISMVRAEMIDHIDRFLRINRDDYRPFGGVQVVFFGDLFQLPPVVSTPEEQHFFQTYYDSPYFFSAKVFQDTPSPKESLRTVYPDFEFEMEMMELKKVYRQEARHFVRLLDAVRLGTIDYDDLEDLNERYAPNFNEKDYFITLSTRNSVVDDINSRELRNLPIGEYSYTAEINGAFDPKQYPTEGVLRLKLGAQVMFMKNDPKREYVNGTIGKIVKLDVDRIVVEVEERGGTTKRIEVEQQTWEILRYTLAIDGSDIKTDVVGSFKQYPLRLAWAITIHKSQGKTFDKVIIDLSGGAFEVGQTYVALSRCRTLQGIILKTKIQPRDIKVDERIVDFYERQF
ncbi:MAG: AAA family ATPase [Saprospiraceae bacterium]|nr:AAA family ATPase [Saprospiraceae bacterium]